MIAALFVIEGGVYYGLKNVDPWPSDRDARKYRGPWPVIAHPPCAGWGRYARRAGGSPGDDGGCFRAALRAVRKYGGVLEHPAYSHAWAHHSLARPPFDGGWIKADRYGVTCHVEQGWYGHSCPKATWLYCVGCSVPDLRWGRSAATGNVESLTLSRRAITPVRFRNLLIRIAETAK